MLEGLGEGGGSSSSPVELRGVQKIGDGCGGFIAVDEDTTFFFELQWARILVKLASKELPSSLEIVVGLGCFFVQLWWKMPPWFVQVVPTRGSSVFGVAGGREEEDVSPCAAPCGFQRGREVQSVVLGEAQENCYLFCCFLC